MKKKKINNLFDNILWYTLYLLPIWLYIFYLIGNRMDTQDFTTFFNTYLNLPLFYDNIVFTTISQLFGDSGVLPLFYSDGVMIYLVSYYVSVMLLHLAVDFLLFIPRLAHKYMEKFCGGD